MQLGLAMIPGSEMAHKACENTYFSGYSLQLLVANLHPEMCTVALSWTYSAGLGNSDSVNPASMQVSTYL